MEGFQFLSCIHFSIQLIAAEMVFLISIPRKRRFWLRTAYSMTLYCLCPCRVFLVAASISGRQQGDWFLLDIAYTLQPV